MNKPKIKWREQHPIEAIKQISEVAMLQHLGIEFTQITETELEAIMPVNDKTKQPAGLLHGGASCVLIESLGSIASYLCIDRTRYDAVGIEINANHLASATEGRVIGTCTPLRVGANIHVWEVKVHHETSKKLICVGRLTVAVVKKRSKI